MFFVFITDQWMNNRLQEMSVITSKKNAINTWRSLIKQKFNQNLYTLFPERETKIEDQTFRISI